MNRSREKPYLASNVPYVWRNRTLKKRTKDNKNRPTNCLGNRKIWYSRTDIIRRWNDLKIRPIKKWISKWIELIAGRRSSLFFASYFLQIVVDNDSMKNCYFSRFFFMHLSVSMSCISLLYMHNKSTWAIGGKKKTNWKYSKNKFGRHNDKTTRKKTTQSKLKAMFTVTTISRSATSHQIEKINVSVCCLCLLFAKNKRIECKFVGFMND